MDGCALALEAELLRRSAAIVLRRMCNGDVMKLRPVTAAFFLTVAFNMATSADVYADQMSGSPAVVPQLSQGGGSPAYIEQMPPGAKVRAPTAKRRPPAKPASGNTLKGPAVVGKPATALPAYPSVGTGAATELVAPNVDGFFPSVGLGTVSRRASPLPGVRR